MTAPDAQQYAETRAPHRYPDSLIGPDAPGEELLAWRCQRCGQWVSEYADRDACPGEQYDGEA